MPLEISFILSGSAGFFCVQIVQWWIAVNNSNSENEKKAAKSVEYWILFVTMIPVAGLSSYYLFFHGNEKSIELPFVSGAGITTILMRAIKAVALNNNSGNQGNLNDKSSENLPPLGAVDNSENLPPLVGHKLTFIETAKMFFQ